MTQLWREHTYVFKHAFTQEVAYQSLLVRTRQQYHTQIAQVLVKGFADMVQLAHH